MRSAPPIRKHMGASFRSLENEKHTKENHVAGRLWKAHLYNIMVDVCYVKSKFDTSMFRSKNLRDNRMRVVRDVPKLRIDTLMLSLGRKIYFENAGWKHGMENTCFLDWGKERHEWLIRAFSLWSLKMCKTLNMEEKKLMCLCLASCEHGNIKPKISKSHVCRWFWGMEENWPTHISVAGFEKVLNTT